MKKKNLVPKMPKYADIYAVKPEMAVVASDVWRVVVDELSGRGELRATTLNIVDRYARAAAEYADIYPEASEGPIKKGPNGGDVFRFEWSACDKLSERLSKLEGQLGLNIQKKAEPKKEPKKVKTVAADKYLD